MRRPKELNAMGKLPMSINQGEVKVVEYHRDRYCEQHAAVKVAVKRYLEMGFVLTPMVFREKRPIRSSWQKERLTTSQIQAIFDAELYNVGIVNGEASRTLDVDIDCSEAAVLAPSILPPTPFWWGTASKPNSHALYRLDNGSAPKTLQMKSPHNDMLVELRSKNSVTAAPPSIHPSGETYEGEISVVPAMVNPATLEMSVRLIGAGVMALRHYPADGGRHHFALVFGAALARSKANKDQAIALMKGVADAARDDECEDRTRAVADTYDALERGVSIASFSSLSDILGDQVACHIYKMLGVKTEPRRSAATTNIGGIVLNTRGQAADLRHNVVMYLRSSAVWQGVIAYDERSGRAVFRNPPPFKVSTELPAPIDDVGLLRVGEWLSAHRNAHFSTANLYEGTMLVANDTPFDPVADDLKRAGDAWDGIDRLTRLLSTYFGAENSEYTRLIGPKFMIQAVARVFSPGCQADHIFVLEGPQGCGKSSAFRVLGGKYHSADPPDVRQSKELKEWAQGIWIIEMSELNCLGKAAASAIKSILTETKDRFRAAYGRYAEDRPRRAVFVGTTNEDRYLSDESGNRRFWPVRCEVGRIPLEKLKADREQLWGEAVARYQRGELWYPVSDQEHALIESQQSQRILSDEFAREVASLADQCVKQHGYAALDTVLAEFRSGCTSVPHNMKQRIGQNLTAQGWRRASKRTPEGGRLTVYYPPVSKVG